jgi:NAD(P)H-flavin reductase
MAVQILQGKIFTKAEVAKDTYAIKFTCDTMPTFDFQPGQFVTITVAPMTKRSYSIASAPGKDFIELIADTKRGGPGSQFFVNAKEGDTFEFIFPLGVFFYHEGTKPVYFFGTGTGIVPFMSMAEHALTNLKTTRDITMYCGFRYEEEVFAKEFLELLDIHYENFWFKLNLTQPTEDWTGPVGRITQYIDELKDTDIEAYICGSNQMVTDVKEKLIAKGVPSEQIYHEMFY